MKKPTTLYRYDVNRRINKHKITKECCPQVEVEYPYGLLFRCRCGGDNYGYASLKEAKLEAIQWAKQEIYDCTEFIKKLNGEK